MPRALLRRDIQPADTAKCHPEFSRKLITSTAYSVWELMCHELRMKTRVTIHRPDVVVPLQAIELGDGFRAAATALTDVPHLDAALAAGVNVLGRIRNCHGADHLAVRERVYLTRVTRYSWADEGVLRERNWLHLPFAGHVKAVRTATRKERLIP